MMPQEVFDQFYEKINPQPSKAKSHNKTEKKKKGECKGKIEKSECKELMVFKHNNTKHTKLDT